MPISKKFRLPSIKFLHQDIAILLLIFIIGIILRLYTLNTALFGDEHHTIKTALFHPFSYIISHNIGSFLYTILVHFLLPLGKLEVVSRLPAFIFGSLGIYAIYLTAKLFFGRKEALFAAAYLAVSPFHIYWSQFARGYSVYLFFSVFSLYFFFKSIRENKLKFWVGYVVCSVLQIYSHFFGVFTFPVHILFMGILICCTRIKCKALWTLDKKTISRFAVSLILIGVITFILHLPDINVPGGIERIVGRTSISLGENLELFGKIILQAFSWETQSWTPNIAFSILIYFFFIVGIIASMRKFKNQIILIFLYITIPVILLLSVRPLNTTIRNAPDRYLIFLLPLFFFLISKGVSAFWPFVVNSYVRISKGKISSDIRSRYVSTGVFITFLIFAGFLFPQLKEIYHYRQNIPDSRGALLYVNKHIQNDDIVVLEGSFLDFFNHANVKRIFPIYINNYNKRNIIVINKYEILKRLKGIMNQKRQLWGVVYTSDIDITDKRLECTDIKNFKKISVIRFDRGTLLENLKKLLDTFTILRKYDREDYHLMLAQIYLLERDIKKAKKEIQILRKIDSFDLINKKKLTPPKKFTNLRKITNIYKKIYKDFLALGEHKESFILYIRYTAFLKSENKTDVAIRDVKKLLTHRINIEDKNWFVSQFMDLLSSQEGMYFIWQDPDGWHIRWKGKNGTRFYGKIISSLKISSLKKYQFREEDRYDYSSHFIDFNSTSFNEEICGLDFQVSNSTKLKFDLSINENRIPKGVVIAGTVEFPRKIPFYYKNYEWNKNYKWK